MDLHRCDSHSVGPFLREVVHRVLFAVDCTASALSAISLEHYRSVYSQCILLCVDLQLTQILSVFLVLFMLFTFFSLVFGCVPIAANWNFALRPPPIGTGSARCLSLTTYRNIALVNSSKSRYSDLSACSLPWKL